MSNTKLTPMIRIDVAEQGIVDIVLLARGYGREQLEALSLYERIQPLVAKLDERARPSTEYKRKEERNAAKR